MSRTTKLSLYPNIYYKVSRRPRTNTSNARLGSHLDNDHSDERVKGWTNGGARLAQLATVRSEHLEQGATLGIRDLEPKIIICGAIKVRTSEEPYLAPQLANNTTSFPQDWCCPAI